MKALLITCFPDNNGIGKYARIYGESLKNSGYCVETLYLQTPRQFGKNIQQGEGRLVVKNFVLGVFYQFKKVARMYLNNKRGDYDLYVLTTPLLLPLTTILPKEKVEVILLDAYAYKLSLLIKSFAPSIIQIFYIWYYLKKPIRVVFISHYTQNEFVKYIGKRLQEVPNRVFMLPLELLKTGIEYFDLPSEIKGKDIFLNVGRDVPNKNIKTFLKIAEHYLGDDTKMFVRIGLPSKENDRYIRTNKIVNVIHLNNLEEKKLNYLYSISRAYIHTAYFEGLGLPPLEAYAHGCYVISTNCSDLPTYLKDSNLRTFIDDPDNVYEYIKAIDEVCNKGTKSSN